jgi:glycosyltransferase involved in cell wall biosynthesis
MNGVDYMSDYRIGVITMPVFKAGITPLSNLITILCSLTKTVFLMTGDEGYVFFRKDKRLKTFNISQKTSAFFISRIVNYLLFQVKMSLEMVKMRKQIDIFLFFMGGESLLLPTLTAHLLRKKVVLMFASSSVKIQESQNDPLAGLLKISQFISCTIADVLIVYTKHIISEYSLERWNKKIVIAREHYIDFDSFRIKEDYHSRECIVGYIGRFSEEKGIVPLLYAVPDAVIKNPDTKFLFIGDGSLRPTIERYIQDNNLSETIILPGWVSHDVLADYLNKMKLLVIPSDTEGLPNVMLEAMACGTPVLATPVGGIPTIIKDGETGFILKNNSSPCIASNIVRLLDDHKIVTVIGNANQLMQNEFRFEKRVEEFTIMFDHISSG